MVFIIRIVETVAFAYIILIAVRAFMTWLRPEVIYAYRGFFDFAVKLVDPLLGFVRKVFPVNIGRVDLSPVIAIILVETVKFILIYFIRMLMSGGAA